MYEEEMNEYINILLNKPEDKPCRDYLNSRGITKDTAIFWKLGYCPVGYKPRCCSNEQFPFWLKMHGGLTILIFDDGGKNEYDVIRFTNDGKIQNNIIIRRNNSG